MKRLNLLLILSFLGLSLAAQSDLTFAFNSTPAGRNLTLGYAKTCKVNNVLGVGLRYNINQLAHPDDQDHLFYKRLYATEFIEHLGIQAYYQRNIFNNLPAIKPFLLYDIQATKSVTRNNFDPDIEHFGPFVWIEHSIGIGFKVNIYKSLHLVQKAGMSVVWLIGKDDQIPETYDNFTYEFGYLLSTGLSYRL